MPYIFDFSPTGVMTIGWDRYMKPYEIPSEIPPSEIAIKQELFDSYENAQNSDEARGRMLIDSELLQNTPSS